MFYRLLNIIPSSDTEIQMANTADVAYPTCKTLTWAPLRNENGLMLFSYSLEISMEHLPS